MTVRTVLLFASLALNVFVLGVVVGGKAAGLKIVHPAQVQNLMERRLGSGGGPQMHVGGGLSLRPILSAASPERREELRRLVGDEMIGVRRQAMTIESARLDLLEALEAEDFSPERVRAAMQGVAAAEGAMRASVNESILMLLSELTPDERAQAIERFKHMAERRRKVGERMRERFNDRRPPPGEEPLDPPDPEEER